MLERQSVCSETDRSDLKSINLSPLSIDALDQSVTEGSFYLESEDDLFVQIFSLGSEYGPLLRYIEIGFLSVEWIWGGISDRFRVLELDSVMISGLSEIFSEFRRKQFPLLWRGGCNGFRAHNFHDRCDGHVNTLTLIEDTNGNIFGGFTLVNWESRVWNRKGRRTTAARNSRVDWVRD
jgi:hypothetical protein